MNRSSLLDDLLSTADDEHLSRSERKALRALIEEADLDDRARAELVVRLVRSVGERLRDPRDRGLVDWLGDAAGMLTPREGGGHPPSRVVFGPEDPMVETLLGALQAARQLVDIAVFTITDDRVTQTLLGLHRRGIRLRILSDDAKAWDPGSDIHRLAAAGVAVFTDRSEGHFHHKFAVIDARVAITGSYNWTRGADRDNRENLVVSQEPALVDQYARAFARMWAELGGLSPS